MGGMNNIFYGYVFMDGFILVRLFLVVINNLLGLWWKVWIWGLYGRCFYWSG